MIFIPHHAEWIEVESAFGRLSINKLKALFKSHCSYSGLNENSVEVVEYIALHLNTTQNR